MKLELKHIAPYLPYGVKGEVNNHEYNEKHIDELDTISYFDKVITFRNEACDVYLDNSEFGTFKPILRPLRDLTKEIEIYGKKQMFMSSFFMISAEDEELFFIKGIIPEYWKVNIKMLKNNNYNHLDYWIVDKLFEWHFDIFGLIPKRLAIDINTL